MKKNLFMAALMLLSVVTVSAKVWRVNPNTGIDADFKSIQEALDAANKNEQGAVESLIVADGDTLYCEPGNYGNVTISRPMTLIGTGFGDITNGVQLGSENCAVFARITIKNNYVNLIGLNAAYITGQDQSYNDHPSYCLIERCKVASIDLDLYDTSCFRYTTIKNCYINVKAELGEYAEFTNNILCTDKDTYYSSLVFSAEHSTVKNNVISNVTLTYIGVIGCEITDNIIIPYDDKQIDLTDNTVHNNILGFTGGDGYENFSNNLYGTQYTAESIFKMEGQYAEMYKIKEGHTALTYSTTGGEIGAYGGNAPFEPSMRPLGMPYIYDVTVEQDNENQTIQLNFKAKSQNE